MEILKTVEILKIFDEGTLVLVKPTNPLAV